jgi:hypothetical protein
VISDNQRLSAFKYLRLLRSFPPSQTPAAAALWRGKSARQARQKKSVFIRG